jgi:hypothetical protein
MCVLLFGQTLYEKAHSYCNEHACEATYVDNLMQGALTPGLQKVVDFLMKGSQQLDILVYQQRQAAHTLRSLRHTPLSSHDYFSGSGIDDDLLYFLGERIEQNTRVMNYIVREQQAILNSMEQRSSKIRQMAFQSIYNHGLWADESNILSGPGSKLERSRGLRSLLTEDFLLKVTPAYSH